MTTVAVDPDTVGTELEAQAGALADSLAGGAIVTVDDLARAVAARADLADMRRRVVDYFAPIKAMAHKLHRALCDREHAIVDPIDARDRAIAAAMSAFKADQDRARRDREREEQARRQHELDAAILAEAATLETAGASAVAAALVEDAIVAPRIIVVEPDRIKDAGAKFVRRWKWRLVDAAQVPREFLVPDDVKIGQYVRAMKSSGAIPGVEIYAVDEPVR